MKLLCGSLAMLLLAGCSVSGDWHEQAAEQGRQMVRADLGTVDLRFLHVETVGDQRSGQVCGTVVGDGLSSMKGVPARFIVYIDGTAGPWIEHQQGKIKIPDTEFDVAWQRDCVNEGWGRG